MSVAYRIRTPAGQELSFATRAMFEDFVRSGDLSPDDLVYDAGTGSWAPARTHPVVLELESSSRGDGSTADTQTRGVPTSGEPATPEDPIGGLSLAPEQAVETRPSDPDMEGVPEIERQLVRESTSASTDGVLGAEDRTESPPESDAIDPLPSLAEPGPVEPSPDASPDPSEEAAHTDAALDLDLELAPFEVLSPEEASQKFIDDAATARAQADPSIGTGSAMSTAGLSMDHGGSMGELISAPSVARRPSPVGDPDETASDGGAARGSVRKRASGKSGRWLFWVVGFGILGTGAYLWNQGVFAASGGSTPPIEGGAAGETESTQPIASEPEIRRIAEEQYLVASEMLTRDLPAIPDSWGTSEYLLLPSSMPRITAVWESYRAATRRLRSGNTERYREAFLAALDDAGVGGEEGTSLLERAVADFRRNDSRREAHLARVDALAAAAIRSHQLLLRTEGLLVPDPSGARGFLVGASGRDRESERVLEQVIESLRGALEGGGEGPRAPDNVREWTWSGFLDASTD